MWAIESEKNHTLDFHYYIYIFNALLQVNIIQAIQEKLQTAIFTDMINHNLLVLGAQNAKLEDQKLPRSQIKPVQILIKNGKLKSISFFNDWGKVGVNSIAWHKKLPICVAAFEYW